MIILVLNMEKLISNVKLLKKLCFQNEKNNNIKNAKFADKCILKIAQVMKKGSIKFCSSVYKTKGSN